MSSPRSRRALAGYKPGTNQAVFAIEKRAGGHTFQLNFSNGIGTTRSQVARGAFNNDDWYHGLQHLAQVLLSLTTATLGPVRESVSCSDRFPDSSN